MTQRRVQECNDIIMSSPYPFILVLYTCRNIVVHIVKEMVVSPPAYNIPFKHMAINKMHFILERLIRMVHSGFISCGVREITKSQAYFQ